MSDRPAEYLRGLVAELRKWPGETPWLEFKENNSDAREIGEYLSALSNAAALEGKANAYLIWGVRDGDREIVGTTFRPTTAKRGNEDLENWLVRLLSPRIHFRFHETEIGERRVVLLEIPRASGRPVRFEGIEYVRVGSYRQKLKDHPQLERDLWRIFDTTPFEELIAAERLDAPGALAALDYPGYFDLMKLPLPGDRDGILERLVEDRILAPNEAGGWNVTCLGALLFAKNLETFGRLGRKAVRVIVYEGRNRLKTEREHVERGGYASAFERLIEYLNALLPRAEKIGPALRDDEPVYPELAIRELVANALIHQDLSVTGAGPTIEIFADRMEISNPGRPLVRTERFLDTPPRSRNEALASLMRRVGICEERGSGVDKVVFETERHRLPPPLFETPEDSTRTVLFGPKPLKDLARDERVRACYLHACLRYVERDPMTNASLRERFGIEEDAAKASRVIQDAIRDGLIKPRDPNQGKKYAKYVPSWA